VPAALPGVVVYRPRSGAPPPIDAPPFPCNLDLSQSNSFLYDAQTCLPHYREPWFIDRAVERHRQFLHLHRASPGNFIVPAYDMDLVWHTHMVSGLQSVRTYLVLPFFVGSDAASSSCPPTTWTSCWHTHMVSAIVQNLRPSPIYAPLPSPLSPPLPIYVPLPSRTMVSSHHCAAHDMDLVWNTHMMRARGPEPRTARTPNTGRCRRLVLWLTAPFATTRFRCSLCTSQCSCCVPLIPRQLMPRQLMPALMPRQLMPRW